MKVKHIVNEYIDEFQELINEFIEDKDIKDIKYSNYVDYDYARKSTLYFSALIIYEE